MIPGGDYFDPNTPFYTSRNSYSSTQQTGGIALIIAMLVLSVFEVFIHIGILTLVINIA